MLTPHLIEFHMRNFDSICDMSCEVLNLYMTWFLVWNLLNPYVTWFHVRNFHMRILILHLAWFRAGSSQKLLRDSEFVITSDCVFVVLTLKHKDLKLEKQPTSRTGTLFGPVSFTWNDGEINFLGNFSNFRPYFYMHGTMCVSSNINCSFYLWKVRRWNLRIRNNSFFFKKKRESDHRLQSV